MKSVRRIILVVVMMFVLSGLGFGAVGDNPFHNLLGQNYIQDQNQDQEQNQNQNQNQDQNQNQNQQAISTPEPLPTPPPEPDTPPGQPEVSDPTPAPGGNLTAALPYLPSEIINPWRTNFPSPFVGDRLSDLQQSWSFRRNAIFQPPEAFMRYDIRPFGGDYLGDITRPVLYLTFDLGYEMGYTGLILDTLRDRGVSATFFVTAGYIRNSPDFVRRMVADGHVVGNHSATHRQFSQLTDLEIMQELRLVEDLFLSNTGVEMPRFFRFPYGDYSMRALYTVYRQGYLTFFWSLAYMDWDPNNQPGKDVAFRQVTNHVHNGAVILLHAAQSNALALGDIIDHLHAAGFTFETLEDLQY